MRLLQLSVPEEQRDAVLDTIRDRELGHVVTAGAGEGEGNVIINVVVPADAVEYVLGDLTEAGYDRSGYTVSLDAEFASFTGIDEVQNRWANTPNKIAPATLRSKAKDMRLNTRSYLWMMVLSAIVAVAGLLLSSPAVVVGSMVIAPIVSPSLTAIVGGVRNDRDMLLDSIHQQALGLGVSIVVAILFAVLVRESSVVPIALDVKQMALVAPRMSPTILSAAVGVAAGSAGAWGLATKGQVSIVGVMIAAALIPTAAAVGIGVAWGNPVVAVGALLLLVLNVLAINVGGAATLFYLGYRPDEIDESLFSIDRAREAVVVGGTVLLVVVTAALVGAGFYQQSTFERTVNDATSDVLDREEYRELGVLDVIIEYRTPGPFSEPTSMTVALSRTADREFPDLPNVLDRTISERTGEDVVVQVRYVDYDRSDDAEAE